MFLDDILSIASGYNLLTPLLGFFQDIKPHTPFGVNLYGGFTTIELADLLEQAGVEAWAFMDDADRNTIIFNVREDHTRLAYMTLKGEGITIFYPVLEDR